MKAFYVEIAYDRNDPSKGFFGHVEGDTREEVLNKIFHPDEDQDKEVVITHYKRYNSFVPDYVYAEHTRYKPSGIHMYLVAHTPDEIYTTREELDNKDKSNKGDKGMKAKLVIEGKEFPIEILDPQLQELIKPTKKTGYEMPKDPDSTVYWEDTIGSISRKSKSRLENMLNPNETRVMHDDLYKSANYYSDQTVAENNARADQLMRQLRRFAVEHRTKSIDWTTTIFKYYIDYDHRNNKLYIARNGSYQPFGIIVFDTIEAANDAIDEFHEELIWYFTKYNDSL